MNPWDRAAKQFMYLKPIVDRYDITSMLDIGCGLALGSILIAKYKSFEYLALLDGDGEGAIFHDYREGAPAWNNVEIAGAVARAELPDCRIDTFVQDTWLTIPVDMIVSFKSWGTHYPIREYIPLAARSLTRGGVVVTDLRPGPQEFRDGQVDEMQAVGFDLVQCSGKEMRSALFVKR